MAVTVTDDTVNFEPVEAGSTWIATNFSQPAFDPDAAVQGSNCIEARGISGGGIGTIMTNPGNTNIQDKHFYTWARQSWIWATFGAATPGVSIRLSTSATGATNWVDFAAAGQDKGVTSFKGWVNCCVDIKAVPHGFNGTTPEQANSGNGLIQVPTGGLEINFLTGNNKTAALIDELKAASRLIIGGGTTGDPGLCAEISSNDETLGDGFFKSVGGVFFCNIGLRFGNTASASSEFRDQVRTIVFEDWDVSADHYTISHVGNATGTNNFQLGERAGTGVDEVGSNGCVIQSAGNAPWHIHSENTNVDLAGYYGCTFIGPPAFSIYGDTHRDAFVEDNSAASFTYVRYDLTRPSALNVAPFTSAPALNDALYLGNGMPWSICQINVAVAKSGTYTRVWEYWNGSAWTSVPNLGDGTNDFALTGTNFVTWDTPDDWATTAVNSRTQYWVRCRISAFTSSTTAPTLSACYPYQMPQMFFLNAGFEMITGSMIGMGPIKVRNGANFKRVSVVGSVHTGHLGALDLGSADPTANTVRDISISNCPRGVLLRGTSTGSTTYNFRNITFDNNGIGITTVVEDNSLSSFTIDDANANNDTANNVTVFPATAAVNDAFYIGFVGESDHFNINVGTAGAGTYSVTWEYWSGSAWTALSGVTDGTNAFKTAGLNTVTFTRPTTQTWTSLGATGFYSLMIRARISSFTSMTTNPLITRITQDGDVRVDFPAAATITINVLEGGTIPKIDNVNGSTVNVVANTSVTFQGMKDNSEVRVYNASTGAEVAGIEDATAGTADNRSFAWSAAQSTVVNYVIHNFQPGDEIYETIRVNGFTVPTNDVALDINQRIDRNAEN